MCKSSVILYILATRCRHMYTGILDLERRSEPAMGMYTTQIERFRDRWATME